MRGPHQLTLSLTRELWVELSCRQPRYWLMEIMETSQYSFSVPLTPHHLAYILICMAWGLATRLPKAPPCWWSTDYGQITTGRNSSPKYALINSLDRCQQRVCNQQDRNRGEVLLFTLVRKRNKYLEFLKHNIPKPLNQ